MRDLRRFAVLALAVVTAMSLGVPASAATNAGSQSLAPEAADPVSYIWNHSSSQAGIGVMNVWDGSYVHGLYDAALPVNQRTDTHFGWARAEGIYVGPGYCADLWFFNGSVWQYGTTHGPGQWRVSQSIPGQNVARWYAWQYRC